MLDRYQKNLVCPNYTPRKWWECDVFELTAAGYFTEYEIKLTRADFKADSKKIEKSWTGPWDNRIEVIRKKHDLLAAGDPTGPSRFWYVAPEGILVDADIPAWAGLITCHVYSEKNRFGVQTTIVKEAPRLHKVKLEAKRLEHLRSIFYYRFLNRFLHGKDGAEEIEPPIDLASEVAAQLEAPFALQT